MPSDFEREYKEYIESTTPDFWDKIEAGIMQDDDAKSTEDTDRTVTPVQTADAGDPDVQSYVNRSDNKVIRRAIFAKRAGQIAAAIALVFVAYALVQVLAKGGMRASESAAPMADAAPAAAAEAPAYDASSYDSEPMAEAAYEAEEADAVMEEGALTEAEAAADEAPALNAEADSVQSVGSDKKNSLTADTYSSKNAVRENETDMAKQEEGAAMILTIGDKAVDVDWEDNDAVRALKELASSGPLTIDMSMYGGFEQVGSIGMSLPSDDEQISTEIGDIVLYSSDQIVVFYGSNTWSYTRLGKITGLSDSEIKDLLSRGDVSITISAK